MKRVAFLIVLVAILLPVLSVEAAAPQQNGYFKTVANKTVNDSQHTALAWEMIDSLAYTLTDTARIYISIRGVAELDPGEELFICVTRDSVGNQTDPAASDDTLWVKAGWNVKGKSLIPFEYGYIDSVVSQTDKVDTCWFIGATKASNQSITLRNVRIIGIVGDKSAASE